LVVMTAVDGASLSEICTRAFCTAIAETPSMAATIMIAAFGSAREPTPITDREKAGKEQKLQEQQWPQGGDPGPIESCRQKSRCNERDDKHRHGQQMRRRRVLASSGSCRKDHEIACNVGDEQGPQPEEPDHVHAACDDAQHKSQQLGAERIADRFHGLRFFDQWFKFSHSA
jgi:hypothetical protein